MRDNTRSDDGPGELHVRASAEHLPSYQETSNSEQDLIEDEPGCLDVAVIGTSSSYLQLPMTGQQRLSDGDVRQKGVVGKLADRVRAEERCSVALSILPLPAAETRETSPTTGRGRGPGSWLRRAVSRRSRRRVAAAQQTTHRPAAPSITDKPQPPPPSYTSAMSAAAAGDKQPDEERPGRRRRRAWFLAALVTARVTMALSLSVMPPFLPRLAERRGLGPSVYGLVLATNCLMSTLATPLLGRHLARLQPRRTLLASLPVSALAGGLCALLPALPTGTAMAATAILLKAVQALADAGLVLVMTSYTCGCFSRQAGLLFSVQVSAAKLANLLGPAAAGLLYQRLGFPGPLLAAAALHLLVTPLLWLTADSELDARLLAGRGDRRLTASHLPAARRLLLPCSAFVVAAIGSGFLAVNMEAQVLRRYNLNEAVLGLVFGLGTGAGSLVSPLVGRLCDRLAALSVPVAIFCTMNALAFWQLSSASLPLWRCVAALCVCSVSAACLQVCGMALAMRQGGGDAAATCAVACLWTTVSGAARFSSRSGSGLLVETVGMHAASLTVSGAFCVVVILSVASYTADRLSGKTAKFTVSC